MHRRWTRVVTAALVLSMPFGAPPGNAQAQDPAGQSAELADAVQRFAATLDAVDDYEKLLKGVETFRAALPACTADANAQSLGEALMWSVDASLQADRDLARVAFGVPAPRVDDA